MPLRAVAPRLGQRPRTIGYGLVATCFAGLVAAPAAGAAANPGGAYSSPAPRVKGIECRTLCSGASYARPGSVLLVTGRNLEATETVTFLGTAAAGDEVVVEAERVSAKRLTVRVPRGARSGRVVATNADGATSAPVSTATLRVERLATHRVTSSSGPQIDIAISGRKVFFDADRRPTITYAVHDADPVHVIVELVRSSDRVALVRWDQGLVTPGEPRMVAWDGMAGGMVQKEGRYEFRVYAENSQGAVATSAQADPPGEPASASPESFVFLRHRFPIRGAHTFGTGVAAFGGGRNHQGHDVFAECGTPLVAARGGVVKLKATHSRAGNYLVIDGEQTDIDYVYMHLAAPAMVERGDRVRTGQPIGFVGDTGHADGCHLHFELWSGPGWYSGGSPFDPLPELKSWDRFS
jgi:hypothetical protein